MMLQKHAVNAAFLAKFTLSAPGFLTDPSRLRRESAQSSNRKDILCLWPVDKGKDQRDRG